MKMKTILAVVIMTIAIVFTLVYGLILWFDNLVANAKQEPITYINESIEVKDIENVIPISLPNVTLTPPPTIQTIPSIIPKKIEEPSNTFVSVTISTDKKTKTYEIMPNVDEYTLKNNIGWLPGSSLPSEDGLCVLMGHRDTDFSILQYVEIGDILTIAMNDSQYYYQVTQIEIIESDSALRFKAKEGRGLVLVTCFPFKYTGHAPKKLVVLCRIRHK